MTSSLDHYRRSWWGIKIFLVGLAVETLLQVLHLEHSHWVDFFRQSQVRLLVFVVTHDKIEFCLQTDCFAFFLVGS